MTISQLVQAMEEPATEDLRGYRVLPLVFKAIGKPKSAAVRARPGRQTTGTLSALRGP